MVQIYETSHRYCSFDTDTHGGMSGIVNGIPTIIIPPPTFVYLI